MQNKKISIIVPVYNVAEYLPECLDSIVIQTHKNLEIICVNDGSTDSSLEILENYQKEDERIIIINQENAGVSAARNAALDAATGDYLMFCDPDDYFANNLVCEKALSVIEKEHTDACVFNYSRLVNKKINVTKTSYRLSNIACGSATKDSSIFFPIWDKIYRRSFIEKFKLRFDIKLEISEDIVFSSLLYFYGAKFSFFDEPLYIYRVNRNNSLTTRNIKGLAQDIIAFNMLCSLDITKKQPDNIMKIIINRFLGSCIFYYIKLENYFIRLTLRKTMVEFISFLEKNYSKDLLQQLVNYKKVKKMIARIPFELHYIFFRQKQPNNDFEKHLKKINFQKQLKKLEKKYKNQRIIIYAAGAFFKYITEKFDLSGLNIIGVSDMRFSDEHLGQKFQGYNIIPKKRLFEEKADCILVATTQYEKVIENMMDENTSVTTKLEPLAKISFWEKFEFRK